MEPRAPLRIEKVELPFHAVVAVGERMEESELTVVAQGLRFRLEELHVDPFLNILLLLPEHPTDLACARLIHNAALAETVAELEMRIDQGLLRMAREHKASDPLQIAILERLHRRRMLGDWVDLLGMLLLHQCRHDPEALGETLRRATTPRPEKVAPLERPEFQEILVQVLARLRERRSRFLTHGQLNALVETVACLPLLRPVGELARRVADEAVRLLLAEGNLKTAVVILEQLPQKDERLGLLRLCLGHPEKAEPLLVKPFHRGLYAFFEGDFVAAVDLFEEALPQTEGPARLILLDHAARALAFLQRYPKAEELVDLALETSTGLEREVRLAFKTGLRKSRFSYMFNPSGYGSDERWADLRERGLAISSPQDRQLADFCVNLLRSSSDQYPNVWQVCINKLGAAHPMTRALLRALADRYLQERDCRTGLMVGLIPELLALWPHEASGPESANATR